MLTDQPMHRVDAYEMVRRRMLSGVARAIMSQTATMIWPGTIRSRCLMRSGCGRRSFHVGSIR
jgi:hypothetical protein